MLKKTQQEFINELKKVFGEKYDLTNVEYNGYLKKVIMVCPIHGEFSVRADHLLKGCGCHKCAKEERDKKQMLSQEEFINKANKIHNNKYSYIKTTYNGLKNQITIICPIHGEFRQKAGNHLNGCGCPKCARINSSEKRKMNFYDFETKANKVHNNKYRYIEETFNGGNSKITIICPIHGEFKQMASVHLLGQGCPVCGREKATKLISEAKTKEDFIEQSNEKHNYKYSYSKVNYINNYTNVIITCPIHGDFEQIPKNHLNGCGCPKCMRSLLEEETEKNLKLLNIKFIPHANKRTLSWLCNQHLDFYLPDYNIAIECQGEQHFKPIDFAGNGEKWAFEKYEKTKKLDELKLEKCKQHNTRVLYINYNDENISQIIENMLKEDNIF